MIYKQLLSLLLRAAAGLAVLLAVGCSQNSPTSPMTQSEFALDRDSRPSGSAQIIDGQIEVIDLDSRAIALRQRSEKFLLASEAVIVAEEPGSIRSRLTIKDLAAGQYVTLDVVNVDRETMTVGRVVIHSRAWLTPAGARSASE